MADPRHTYSEVSRHARQTKRSVGRLLVSGIGFSAAYFLDPDHGTARRKHALVVLKQARQRIFSGRATPESPSTAVKTAAIRGSLVPHPGTAPRFGANGAKVAAPL